MTTTPEQLIMTTAQRDGFIQALMGDGDTNEAVAMLQSLPMVSAEPVGRIIASPANTYVEVEWVNDCIPDAGATLYISPQALTPITPDDVTDEMVQQWKLSGAESYEPKKDIAAAYNAVRKHRGEA
jgi:hypothetical protein